MTSAVVAPTDSTFLLLSSVSSTTNSNPITYSVEPRSLPILVLAGLIDLGFSIDTLISRDEDGTGVKVLLAWGLARSIFVLYLLSTRRVREKGNAMLGQLIVTCLISLYYFNEIQQRRPDSLNSPLPAFISTLHSILPPFTTASKSIFISLAFSLLHYLLYAIFIGIRRRHNPFVGSSSRTGMGLPRSISRSSWREEHWEGQSEEVGNESIQHRTSSSSYVEEGSDVDDAEEGEGEEGEEESESESDEDEIIDIPKTSSELRSRTSRASLRLSSGLEESTPVRGSRIVSTSNYGSFAGV